MKHKTPFFLADEDNTTHRLSELLPYDPAVKTGPRLEAGLKEYLLLLTAAYEAMTHLEEGNLKHFDPLVGENSCQIRAIKLALTILHGTFDVPVLQKSISESMRKIEGEISARIKIKKSLKEFLLNNECEIYLYPKEIFLVKSYILTRVKVSKPNCISKPFVQNEISDSKKIKEFGNVSSTFAENLVTHLRKKTATTSVKFIQSLVKNSAPHCPNIKMVSQEFMVEHNGLSCLPTYWLTRIALEQAMQHQTPIVMLVQKKTKKVNSKILEEVAIFFESTSDGYKSKCKSTFSLEMPALILSGCCYNDAEDFSRENWIRGLLKYCPVELALACSAAHRQYPDESKDLIFSEIPDLKFHNHKKKANEWGCTLENPTLFLLTHMYCEKIKNLIHV